MQLYISWMFLGLPEDIHEEKRSFLDFENNWLPTDGRTDGRTDRPSYRDARTHLLTYSGNNLVPGKGKERNRKETKKGRERRQRKGEKENKERERR